MRKDPPMRSLGPLSGGLVRYCVCHKHLRDSKCLRVLELHGRDRLVVAHTTASPGPMRSMSARSAGLLQPDGGEARSSDSLWVVSAAGFRKTAWNQRSRLIWPRSRVDSNVNPLKWATFSANSPALRQCTDS